MHEEMPRRGPKGSIAGFQLWVNLPAAQKMSQPRYQEVNAATIPAVEQSGARVRLVAGTVGETRGPVTEIAARPVHMEVQLQANAEFTQPVPFGHTALAYLFEGSLEIEGETIDAVHMIVLADGDQVRITAGAQGARFMVIAGAPFGEPIVPYGPFVMNTREEIQQALTDLRNGTFVT
jgi:redox-sensitive bicupin YhaK (pirin superfamily)